MLLKRVFQMIMSTVNVKDLKTTKNKKQPSPILF